MEDSLHQRLEVLLRGEMGGEERESRGLEWKGDGRLRKSLWWSREVIRRDWVLEELKGIFRWMVLVCRYLLDV